MTWAVIPTRRPPMATLWRLVRIVYLTRSIKSDESYYQQCEAGGVMNDSELKLLRMQIGAQRVQLMSVETT